VRRVYGVVVAAALIAALSFTIARADDLNAPARPLDLGAQLMLRLFGETSDINASFSAARGDRESESPLRELALVIPTAEAKAGGETASAFQQDRFALDELGNGEALSDGVSRLDAGMPNAGFEPPSLDSDAEAFAASGPQLSASYEAASAEPSISPEPGTLAFTPPAVHGADFQSQATQVGQVRFESDAQTPQEQQGIASALHDSAYNAGANFDVRAGKRSVNLNLSSEYEHLTRDDATTFSVSPLGVSSWQLPGSGGAPLAVPSYADLNKLSVGAGLSLPVVHGLTLNLNYDAQRLYGGYGLPGLVNLDTVNNTYGGNLTFNIPRFSSSLSIGAYQDRFQDSLLLNGSTQTHEDVNLTVKF
jgi:hypothetical protein